MATPREKVLQACRFFMVPLARFLVRNGVGFREFADIAKSAFVEVVSNDYGIRGRLTNISRVAVLTGLTRKEVGRIRKELAEDSEEPDIPFGRPEKILDLWYRSAGYLDESGVPLVIPIEGEAPSFRDLVREVGGDIPPGAMMKELIRAGSLREENGHLRVVSRNFIPENTDPDAVLYGGEAIADLTKTVNHNLFREDMVEPLLERRVYADHLDPGELAGFKKIAVSDSEQLLSHLNNWLLERQVDSTPDEPAGIRVGLGVYMFVGD